MRQPKTHLHAVFIGRMQPPHSQHLRSIAQALEQAQYLLVLLGSSNLARSSKNPFSYAERIQMLIDSLLEKNLFDPMQLNKRLAIVPLPDYFDANLWTASVRQQVEQHFGSGTRPALVGLKKDASSSYLDLFADWPRLKIQQTSTLSASQLRQMLWQERPLSEIASLGGLSEATISFLQKFRQGEHFERLQTEWQTLNTAKATISAPLLAERWLWRQQGQVWLRRRNEKVGQGLLTFPSRLIAEAPPQSAMTMVLNGASRSPLEVSRIYQHLTKPPASLLKQGAFYNISEVLAEPQQFFADHGVELLKITTPQHI